LVGQIEEPIEELPAKKPTFLEELESLLEPGQKLPVAETPVAGELPEIFDEQDGKSFNIEDELALVLESSYPAKGSGSGWGSGDGSGSDKGPGE
jgi:hypothetical protein